MVFNWFKIFNKSDFDALGLVSKSYNYAFKDIGDVVVHVTKSNSYNVLYEDTFLSLGLNDENPFIIDGKAIYSDLLGNVYLGLTP